MDAPLLSATCYGCFCFPLYVTPPPFLLSVTRAKECFPRLFLPGIEAVGRPSAALAPPPPHSSPFSSDGCRWIFVHLLPRSLTVMYRRSGTMAEGAGSRSPPAPPNPLVIQYSSKKPSSYPNEQKRHGERRDGPKAASAESDSKSSSGGGGG